MKQNQYKFVFGAAMIILFLFSGFAFSADKSPQYDYEAMEREGIDPDIYDIENINLINGVRQTEPVDSLPPMDVLLIPNSTTDDVGMYDPATGDFLGIFVTDPTHLSTPICAIVGPDSNGVTVRRLR